MKIHPCWNELGAWGDGSCPELERAVHCRNCPTYARAAVELLDRELPPGYLIGASGRLALSGTAPMRGGASAVIFRIGAEWLALATIVFKEVCEVRPIHSLPHQRGGVVRGIANIRGELLVCVSLCALLGIERSQTNIAKSKERLLVAGPDGSRVVFPVDEVHGIHRFDASELRDAPATVARATSTYTRAMLSWQQHSVGVLDHQLLFTSLNRSLS